MLPRTVRESKLSTEVPSMPFSAGGSRLSSRLSDSLPSVDHSMLNFSGSSISSSFMHGGQLCKNSQFGSSRPKAHLTFASIPARMARYRSKAMEKWRHSDCS